jgi:hypothetical protein
LLLYTKPLLHALVAQSVLLLEAAQRGDGLIDRPLRDRLIRALEGIDLLGEEMARKWPGT